MDDLNHKKIKKIIFTDLDGTLLDKNTYSFDKANEALGLIKQKKVPLVICTSKTRTEIEFFRKTLGNKDPFIAENGGAIFIPKSFFDFDFDFTRTENDYQIITLGADYGKLIAVLKQIKKRFPLRCFYEMSVEELSEESGLTSDQARMAKQREFDEAFVVENSSDIDNVLKEIKKAGFNFTRGGRYCHIMGDSNKGKAVKILSDLFKKKYKEMKTMGLGDSENDFAMLDSVDMPYLVMKSDKSYACDKYNKADGIGPVGWNKIVRDVI